MEIKFKVPVLPHNKYRKLRTHMADLACKGKWQTYHWHPLHDVFPHNVTGIDCSCHPKKVAVVDAKGNLVAYTIEHNGCMLNERFPRREGFTYEYKHYLN